MDSIIETFHIDWKTIIAQAVNFGIVFVVLYIFALKPLGKLMKERSEKIEGGLSDAKKSNELLQQATAEYEKNTLKLKQIAIEERRELNKELEQLKAEHLETIKADNDEWVKKRKEQLEVDKKILVDSAYNEIVMIATAMAEKIMNEKNK